MNTERIKELTRKALEESHTKKVEAVFARQFGEHGIVEIPLPFCEELAELIAQDAVNTLRKRWFDANNSIPDTSDARLKAIHNGRKIGLMESVDALVEHFGVE